MFTAAYDFYSDGHQPPCPLLTTQPDAEAVILRVLEAYMRGEQEKTARKIKNGFYEVIYREPSQGTQVAKFKLVAEQPIPHIIIWDSPDGEELDEPIGVINFETGPTAEQARRDLGLIK